MCFVLYYVQCHIFLFLTDLAPTAVRDPDESACDDAECVCLKREGKRALDMLRSGRSRDNIRYLPLRQWIMEYFSQEEEDRMAEKTFPTKLATLCDRQNV